MMQDLTQKLINTWDWLNSYCLSKRDDRDLACGRHAICIVQIDDFGRRRMHWGEAKTVVALTSLEHIMTNYAMDDNLIAKYNDYTYVVVLHYMDDYSEIEEICEEMKEAINDAGIGWDMPLTVSIGAAVCKHDPKAGYQCAMGAAMQALNEAHKERDAIIVSNAIA